MESWMINVAFAVATLIAGYAVMRSNVSKGMDSDKAQDEKIEVLEKFMNEKKPLLDHLSKVEEAYGKKIDCQAKELIELKTKLASVPSMKEVREEFVAKEVFLQMEKHLSEKFAGLQSGISEILKTVKNKD